MSTTSKSYLTSSIYSGKLKIRNNSTSNSSDSNSIGNFLIESSTSRSNKNRKRQTTKELQGLIRVIDDPDDHASDFQVKPSLQRDIQEKELKIVLMKRQLRNNWKKI